MYLIFFSGKVQSFVLNKRIDLCFIWVSRFSLHLFFSVFCLFISCVVFRLLFETANLIPHVSHGLNEKESINKSLVLVICLRSEYSLRLEKMFKSVSFALKRKKVVKTTN